MNVPCLGGYLTISKVVDQQFRAIFCEGISPFECLPVIESLMLRQYLSTEAASYILSLICLARQNRIR